MIIFLLGISSILNQFSDAYVLLQVRKQDDNNSNIDAHIHKVVPSDKFEKFTEKLARQQYKDEDVKMNEVKPITDKKSNVAAKDRSEDYETTKNRRENEINDAHIHLPLETFASAFKNQFSNVPRANDQEIKAKRIHFRNGESSVMYEINSQSVINALNDLLSSKLARTYLDTLTRKAAIAYRSINDDGI